MEDTLRVTPQAQKGQGCQAGGVTTHECTPGEAPPRAKIFAAARGARPVRARREGQQLLGVLHSVRTVATRGCVHQISRIWDAHSTLTLSQPQLSAPKPSYHSTGVPCDGMRLHNATAPSHRFAASRAQHTRAQRRHGQRRRRRRRRRCNMRSKSGASDGPQLYLARAARAGLAEVDPSLGDGLAAHPAARQNLQ